jgi:D-alanyl-D-alanine carboxypeptidase/D-alanyl-D-alanine-endopeptidase (penicillin-binding protein 4)
MAEAVQLSLSARGKRLAGRLAGSVPEGTRTMRIYRRVDDPELLVGYGLVDLCGQLGIEVAAGKVSAGSRQGEPLVSAHRSQPLASVLMPVGKQSNNFYAEMVFKGLTVDDDGAAASFARSSQRVLELLEQRSIPHAGMRLQNGSGLFDANRVSAATVVRLLASAYRDPSLSAELVAQLSIGGVDGTLRSRFRSQRASRRVRAKTGTLAAVSTLSGYVLGSGDRPTLAFALLINDVPGSAAALRNDMDRFVSSLVD